MRQAHPPAGDPATIVSDDSGAPIQARVTLVGRAACALQSDYLNMTTGELVHVDIKQLGRISVRGAGHRVLR